MFEINVFVLLIAFNSALRSIKLFEESFGSETPADELALDNEAIVKRQ